MEDGTEQVLEITAKEHKLPVRLNNYKVTLENVEQKRSEQSFILKAMMKSVKLQEKKLNSVEN